MAGESYIVRANRLNFRAQPGLDADIIGRLSNGTVVELLSGTQDDFWWEVKPKTTTQTGFVARRFLGLISSAAVTPIVGLNEILWNATEEAIARGVRYKLGDKDSSKGQIDCSGWVAEITVKAFTAANSAAAPDTLFDRYDHGVLRNHSDSIVSQIQARTGVVLHAPELTADALRDGMLIGINFGNYTWEAGEPPRRYGIDHIVQVMSDPATGLRYITQSSGSGHGVNRQPLAAWLQDCAAKGVFARGRIHAVDPFLMADPHVSYFQRFAAPLPEPATIPAVPAAGAPASFSGRGMYLYTVAGLLRTFGSIENCVRELKRCRMNHIWVRIHGRNYTGDEKSGSKERQKALVAAARSQGIAVAGWGWCQGEDPVREADLAADALEEFGIEDYVADIEQGVQGAKWTEAEVVQFIRAVRSRMEPGAGLGISSHGFIEYQEPRIFRQAAALVDCLNPQAYWYSDKPNPKMLRFAKTTSAKYPLADPAAYARLCFDRWTALYNRPIVISGQSCEELDLTIEEAEEKLKAFLASFRPPPGLLGYNFWHWGTTTQGMRDTLAMH